MKGLNAKSNTQWIKEKNRALTKMLDLHPESLGLGVKSKMELFSRNLAYNLVIAGGETVT